MITRVILALTLAAFLLPSAFAQSEKKPTPPKEPQPAPEKEPAPVKPKRLDYRTPKRTRRVILRKKNRKKPIEIQSGINLVPKKVTVSTWVYRGIVPGRHDAWRFHKRWENKKLSYVTWIGFQKRERRQRIFIQTAQRKSYRILRPSPTRLIVELDNSRVPYRNDRRPILTSKISTRINEIRIKNLKGKQVHIIIDLKRPTPYQQRIRQVNYRVAVSRRKKGVTTVYNDTIVRHYLFLDFPY